MNSHFQNCTIPRYISLCLRRWARPLPCHIVCRPGCDVIISVAVVKIHLQHRIIHCISKIPEVICVLGVVGAVSVQVYVVPVRKNARAPVRRRRDQRGFPLRGHGGFGVVACGGLACCFIVAIINCRCYIRPSSQVGIGSPSCIAGRDCTVSDVLPGSPHQYHLMQ